MVKYGNERFELYKRINSFKNSNNPLDRVSSLHNLISMLTPSGLQRLTDVADQEDPHFSSIYKETIGWLKTEGTKEQVESYAKKAALHYLETEGPVKTEKSKKNLKKALAIGGLLLATGLAGCLSQDEDAPETGIDDVADSVLGPYTIALDGRQDYIGNFVEDGEVHLFRDIDGDEYEKTTIDGNYVKFSGATGAVITEQGIEKFAMDDFETREVVNGTVGAEEIELLEPYIALSKDNKVYLAADSGDMAVIYDSEIVNMWFDTLQGDILSLAGTFEDDIGQIHMSKE